MVEDFERLKKEAKELAEKYDCDIELRTYDLGLSKYVKLKIDKDI